MQQEQASTQQNCRRKRHGIKAPDWVEEDVQSDSGVLVPSHAWDIYVQKPISLRHLGFILTDFPKLFCSWKRILFLASLLFLSTLLSQQAPGLPLRPGLLGSLSLCSLWHGLADFSFDHVIWGNLFPEYETGVPMSEMFISAAQQGKSQWEVGVPKDLWVAVTPVSSPFHSQALL